INGRQLKNESEFVNVIGLMEPGQTVALKFLRGGVERSATLTLGRWPETPAAVALNPPTPAVGESSGFGLSLAKISPDLKDRFGFVSDKGAVIVGVNWDSPAGRGGLLPGDVIVAVDQSTIKDPKEARQRLQDK